VQNPPIRLPTPGKPTCTVVIIRDRDGNEICHVEKEGFDGLSDPKAGDEKIDWPMRSLRVHAMTRFANRGRPTLMYFNGRGRGETSRLMFHEAGIKFEDKRIEFKDWAATKPTTPLGFMPVLTLGNGQVISEVRAVDRAVARLTGLYGTTDEDRNTIDYCYEIVRDLMDSFISKVFTVKNDEELKKKNAGEYFTNTLPPMLRALEKVVSDDRAYFAGASPSVADLLAFDFLGQLQAANPSALSATPKVQGLVARVASRPNIAAYLAARPATW